VKIERSALEPFDFEGLQITDYTAGRGLSSSVAEITVPTGARHRSAWSKRSDKYYLVLEGRLDFVVDGEPVQLDTGDCCTITRGTRFSYRNASDETARFHLVHTPSFDLDAEVFEDDAEP
jgi:mannose-6-phosphate isomerase-like protein (cupin superfamily)